MAMGKHGIHFLADGKIEGADPLAVFGANAAMHLRRYSGFSNSPDLLLNTSYDPETQEIPGFEDQVSLQLDGDEGRLRMPRTMLPPIHGGSDGWFKLKNIKYKSNEITASVAVNVLNNPKLRLDRYTGAISISGKAGDYSGQCKKFDPAETQRQF